MTPGVEQGIAGIRRSFPEAEIHVEEDGSGGAYVTVSPVEIGEKFRPNTTWIGGHLPAQLPYADVYPLFIGSDVTRVDGSAFSAPITAGHSFRGRGAIQISRRTNRLDPNSQTAAGKFL